MFMSKWHLFFPYPLFKYFFPKFLLHVTLEFKGDQSFLFINLTHILFKSISHGNKKATDFYQHIWNGSYKYNTYLPYLKWKAMYLNKT